MVTVLVFVVKESLSVPIQEATLYPASGVAVRVTTVPSL